jgi:hypothetical protein
MVASGLLVGPFFPASNVLCRWFWKCPGKWRRTLL